MSKKKLKIGSLVELSPSKSINDKRCYVKPTNDNGLIIGCVVEDVKQDFIPVYLPYTEIKY